jgi:hypothetical protein
MRKRITRANKQAERKRVGQPVCVIFFKSCGSHTRTKISQNANVSLKKIVFFLALAD